MRGHRDMSKMSSFEGHPSHQLSGGFLNAMLQALRAFAGGIARGHRLYRDYLHLSAMSDPELQDIGIGRCDIFAVVAGTYCRAERPLVRPRKPAGIEVVAPAGNNCATRSARNKW